MAIFRDLSGVFYDIPDEKLKEFRIEAKHLQKRLAEEQVSGVQIGSGSNRSSPGARAPAHITINQYFGSPGPTTLEGTVEGHDQFTFPDAWGG